MDSSYKKGTNFSTKLIPVGLDFLVAKGTAMVPVEILKLSCKIASVKKYWSQVHATTIVANFIPSCSCQYCYLGSSYLIKPVINYEYNIYAMNRQESYPVFQKKEIHKT